MQKEEHSVCPPRSPGDAAPGLAPAEGMHSVSPGTATGSHCAYSAVTEHPSCMALSNGFLFNTFSIGSNCRGS